MKPRGLSENIMVFGEEAKPTMRELWTSSDGNTKKYRELLKQHGYLVKRESVPENHPFEGLTRLCLCGVCGGSFGSPWHQSTASLG